MFPKSQLPPLPHTHKHLHWLSHFCFPSQQTLGLLHNSEATCRLRGVVHSRAKYTDRYTLRHHENVTPKANTHTYRQWISQKHQYVSPLLLRSYCEGCEPLRSVTHYCITFNISVVLQTSCCICVHVCFQNLIKSVHFTKRKGSADHSRVWSHPVEGKHTQRQTYLATMTRKIDDIGRKQSIKLCPDMLPSPISWC